MWMRQIISKYHILSSYLTSIVWSHSLAIQATGCVCLGKHLVWVSHNPSQSRAHFADLVWASHLASFKFSNSSVAVQFTSLIRLFLNIQADHDISLCVCGLKHCHLRATCHCHLRKFTCFLQTHLITPLLCPCQGWGWWGPCWWPWSWAWSRCP